MFLDSKLEYTFPAAFFFFKDSIQSISTVAVSYGTVAYLIGSHVKPLHSRLVYPSQVMSNLIARNINLYTIPTKKGERFRASVGNY